MNGELLVERHRGVLDVVLNRPARRNALTRTLMTQLHDVLLASDEPGLGAVVLRGADGFFCSGLDLGEIRSAGALEDSTQLWFEVHRALAGVPVPVIACLDGGAINAGAALVLGCDLVVAGASGYLQLREAAMGMVPWVNAAWLAARYPAVVGRQLALSCRRFHGPDLHRLGLALDVVPDGTAVTRAHELAAELAGYPNDGGRRTKLALCHADGADSGVLAALAAVDTLRTSG